MGAKQSSHVSKVDKEHRKNVQNHIIIQRKEEINAIENHVISQVQSGNVNVQNVKQVIQATTYAQNQLDRGSKPLNKGDLVAIIIAIDNKRVNDLDNLNNLRIEDLNALIRVIIYDTKNYLPSVNNMIRNESYNTNEVNTINNSSSTLVLTKSKNESIIQNVAPPLPPKSKNNMLTLTNGLPTPPVYALVKR